MSGVDHAWQARGAHWLLLNGSADASVRTKPAPDGRFMWQFRRVVSYAASVEEAKNFVEAGSEFFEVMRRNPYG